MSRLELILSAMLMLSIMFNVGVFVYARNVVSNLLRVSDELTDFQIMISSFVDHLRSVYELDSFYGDQTLEALLEHAKALDEQIEMFEYVYYLTEAEAANQEENVDIGEQNAAN